MTARNESAVPIPDWTHSDGLVPYDTALADMEARATEIADGTASERIWLLEHPPVYTAGTSAQPDELLDRRFPVFPAGRGGRYTYHGPGQRVVYVQLDLGLRGRDIRRYVNRLEGWMLAVLRDFGVEAWRAEGRVGIWTHGPDGREAKIGAIGVRVRRWVTLHGLSLNVAPDLSHFGGIVPCGLPEYPVTSLSDLGIEATMDAVDAAFQRHFPSFLSALATPCDAPLEGAP